MTNLRNFNPESDFYERVAKGDIPGHSLVHQFGSGVLTTTISPITYGNHFRTPKALTSLEVISDRDEDFEDGLGAQQVTVVGIGSGWTEVTQTVTMNGQVAAALGTDLYRINKWYVSRSGSYADEQTGSHFGELTIRESGGGEIWSVIPSDPIAVGESEIGCYTIPSGKTGFLLSKSLFVDSSKSADIYFFKRENANVVDAPYTGILKLIQREVGLQGGISLSTVGPKRGFAGPCDVGFMGKISVSTGDCSVEFELLIVENSYL